MSAVKQPQETYLLRIEDIVALAGKFWVHGFVMAAIDDVEFAESDKPCPSWLSDATEAEALAFVDRVVEHLMAMKQRKDGTWHERRNRSAAP